MGEMPGGWLLSAYTNPKMEKAENPCPARIIGKRKSSIVSDTLVSKLSNLFGKGGNYGYNLRWCYGGGQGACNRTLDFVTEGLWL